MKHSHLSKIYNSGLSLLTDLYQLTMAYGYWKSGLSERESVFHLFYRKNPFKGDYAIASGLSLVIDYLNMLKFEREDIQYLQLLTGADGRPLFEPGFLQYLQDLEFSCDVDAIPEGTVTFPHEPLLRITGPLLQAQLIETALLNLVNFSTLIATKSARISQAAEGDMVLEFGLRRAQGIDGGISASRAAYIGGCHATSNVLAGKLYNIPIKGTHAHSWVMCFNDELNAFSQYAQSMPNNCIFLVDTYDSIEGVRNAIKVGKKLKEQGHILQGIRLDSGDLASISIEARAMLDAAGFHSTAIVASNDLDEFRIKKLKENNAKITVWGVGTRLATAYDQPALGGVYKLAAIKNASGEWEHKVKLSEQAIKISNPGALQVYRYFQNGHPIGDQIINRLQATNSSEIIDFKSAKVVKFAECEAEAMLKPIFRKGELVYQVPTIQQIRSFSLEQQAQFSKINLANYPVGLERATHQLKMELINNAQPV